MPSDTRAPEESAWILAVTSNVTMPCHLFRCLTESTCVVVAYTGKYADKPEFMSQLGTTIADVDCFCIVDWQEWFHCIDEGCLCEVAKAQAPEEKNSEDEIEQVDAPDALADAPPAIKCKTSSGTPRPPKKKQTPNTLQTPDATSAMDALAAKAKQAKPLAKKGKKSILSALFDVWILYATQIFQLVRFGACYRAFSHEKSVCFRHVIECGLWTSIIAALQFTLVIRRNAFLSQALVFVSV